MGTGFTYIALALAYLSSAGTATLGTIIASAAWVVGSIIVPGNIFLLPDSNTTTSPGIYVGTTKVLSLSGSTTTPSSIIYDTTNSQAACTKYGPNFIDCYQEAVFTSTGGCVSGGCATRSYNVASITKPFSGSGSIKKVLVSCDNQGKAVQIDVGQVAATTQSGNTMINNASIGSGILLSFGTGGGFRWNEPTPNLKVSASSTVGPHQACLLQVWSSNMYDPS